MPELPEVETVRQGLQELVSGKTIQSVRVDYSRIVRTDLADFKKKLPGQKIERIGRRGKYLIFYLSEAILISHLRMEGKYRLFEGKVEENKHFHIFFHFKDGSELVYQDVRKFGTMELLPKEQEKSYFEQKKLGPEPKALDFDFDVFCQGLNSSKKVLKTHLLDQTLVAGLGNIYVDEILWKAQIYPARPSNDLNGSEIKKLHQSIIATIAFAIEKGGSSIRTYKNALGKDGTMQNYLCVYGKKGEPCQRCGTIIEKMVLAGRGTHFCPKCQV